MASFRVEFREEHAAQAPSNACDIQDMFFTNILLLGFDVEKNEQRHQIKFSADMFDKSNVRGMEVTMYFLFHRLSPSRAKELFRGVWPVDSDRNRARDFKKVVFDSLKQLEEKGRIPASSVRLSLLQTCSGLRFVQLMWILSNYTLRAVMDREHSSYRLPTLSTNGSALSPTLCRSLHQVSKLYVLRECNRFLENAARTNLTMQGWQEFDCTLNSNISNYMQKYSLLHRRQSNFHKSLTSDSRPLPDALKELRDWMASTAYDIPVWRQLEDTVGKTTKSRILLERILERKPNPYRLGKSNFEKSQAGEWEDKVGESINLNSIVRSWNSALAKAEKLIGVKNTNKQGQSSLFPVLRQIREELETQKDGKVLDSHSKNLHTLNFTMSDEIKKRRQSIQELRENLKNMKRGIGVVPPSSAAIMRLRAGSVATATPKSLTAMQKMSLAPQTPVQHYNASPGLDSIRQSHVRFQQDDPESNDLDPILMKKMTESVRRAAVGGRRKRFSDEKSRSSSQQQPSEQANDQFESNSGSSARRGLFTLPSNGEDDDGLDLDEENFFSEDDIGIGGKEYEADDPSTVSWQRMVSDGKEKEKEEEDDDDLISDENEEQAVQNQHEDENERESVDEDGFTDEDFFGSEEEEEEEEEEELSIELERELEEIEEEERRSANSSMIDPQGNFDPAASSHASEVHKALGDSRDHFSDEITDEDFFSSEGEDNDHTTERTETSHETPRQVTLAPSSTFFTPNNHSKDLSPYQSRFGESGKVGLDLFSPGPSSLPLRDQGFSLLSTPLKTVSRHHPIHLLQEPGELVYSSDSLSEDDEIDISGWK